MEDDEGSGLPPIKPTDDLAARRDNDAGGDDAVRVDDELVGAVIVELHLGPFIEARADHERNREGDFDIIRQAR